MHVWSATTFPATAVLWRTAGGEVTLTAVCKATFALAPGEAEIAATQEAIALVDTLEPSGALRAPSDLCPYKLRADLLIVGSAYSAKPTTAFAARVVVGEVDKLVELHAPRTLDAQGVLQTAGGVTQVPLGWELSAGGKGTANPIGRSMEVTDGFGRCTLPQIVGSGAATPGLGDWVEPAGLGPVAASWPQRSHLAGSKFAGEARWMVKPLPGDLHPAYWNAAPADQQMEFLADDPHLTLENLSPRHARLVTTLPALRFSVFAEGGCVGGSYPMQPDTLWIDTERQIACVTYRVGIPVEDEDALRATVLCDAGTVDPREINVHGATMSFLSEETSAVNLDDAAYAELSGAYPAAEALPFAAPQRSAVRTASGPPKTEPRGREALPFRTALPFEPSFDPARATMAFDGPAHPSNASGSEALPLAPPLAPPPLAPPPLAPPPATPPVGPPPPAPALSVPHPGPAPSGAPQGMPSSPPRPPPQVPAFSRAIESPPMASPAVPAPAPSWTSAPTPEPPKPVVHAARAALDGVVGASNAAADPRPSGDKARRGTRGAGVRPQLVTTDLLDLIWLDDHIGARARRVADWADAVRDDTRSRTWLTGQESVEDAEEDKDRRTIARALTRVPTTEPQSLPRLLTESGDEEGVLARPLIVVAGDLSLTFDPIEVLKATVELSSQAASSEKLKEALEAADGVSKAQRVGTPVVDSLLKRLREAFGQANRSLPNDYLETTVQRTLLEERRYLRRKVLGDSKLVSSLHVGNTATTVYLPEALAERLPVLSRFRTRLVAEPHPQQHPADGDGPALEALAVARVVGSRR